jgi:hypothetical protein
MSVVIRVSIQANKGANISRLHEYLVAKASQHIITLDCRPRISVSGSSTLEQSYLYPAISTHAVASTRRDSRE